MKTLLRLGWVSTMVTAMCLLSVTAEAEEKKDAKGLFQGRCSGCHPTSRPLGATKSAEEWRRTVVRMQGYASGKISDKEAEIIVDYLTEIRGE